MPPPPPLPPQLPLPLSLLRLVTLTLAIHLCLFSSSITICQGLAQHSGTNSEISRTEQTSPIPSQWSWRNSIICFSACVTYFDFPLYVGVFKSHLKENTGTPGVFSSLNNTNTSNHTKTSKSCKDATFTNYHNCSTRHEFNQPDKLPQLRNLKHHDKLLQLH